MSAIEVATMVGSVLSGLEPESWMLLVGAGVMDDVFDASTSGVEGMIISFEIE